MKSKQLLFLTEVWNEDCLSNIDAATNNNGEDLRVVGSAAEASFQLEGTAGSRTLPSCVHTFAYWKPSVLSMRFVIDCLLRQETYDFGIRSMKISG